jgi:hypothetical protein
MVTAFDVGIVSEISLNESLNRLIAISANTAKELDTCIGKCHLCATAYTSANQYICAKRHQNRCKCSVSLTVGVNNDGVCDFAVLYGIYLELFSMPEVLKDLFVFVSNCNFHMVVSPNQILHFPASEPIREFHIDRLHFSHKLFAFI